METQPSEIYRVELAPFRDGEPAMELPPNSRQVPRVDSGEGVEIGGNQPENPPSGSDNNQRAEEAQEMGDAPVVRVEPVPEDIPVLEEASRMGSGRAVSAGPEGIPRPQAANSGAVGPEESNTLSLSFPMRLWMAVEDEALPSLYWNEQGNIVVIEEEEFQRQVLQQEGERKLFETDNLQAFIRLLNMHGFRRTRCKPPLVRSSGSRRVMFYRNSRFKRDHPQLVETIQRKSNVKMATGSEMTGPAPKRRKVEGIRMSPRLHQKDSMKNTEKNALQGAPSAEGPRCPLPFPSPEVCSVSRSTGCPGQNCPPSEQGVPIGERTFSNVPSVHEAGQVFNMSQVFLEYNPMLCMYNILHSILLTTISIMSPQGPQEAEQWQNSSALEAEQGQNDCPPEAEQGQNSSALEAEQEQNDFPPEAEQGQNSSALEAEQEQNDFPPEAEQGQNNSAPEDELEQKDSALEAEQEQNDCPPEAEQGQNDSAPEAGLEQKDSAPDAELEQKDSAPEADLEQNDSDYKSSLCEQLKENPEL